MHLEHILETMLRVTGECRPWTVTLQEGEDLLVRRTGTHIDLRCHTPSAACRGIYMALCHARDNPMEASWSCEEHRHFRDLGLLVDVSRGAVLKKEAVFRLVDHMAALGMNLLMIYTEDTYTMDDYPYFGYLRGRYSHEELREINAYAQELGVELVPCIQVLAHMGSFLQWNDSIHLRDQPTVLLCDDEKAYDLIEAEVRTMREIFPSSRIHIGMDEAASVGLGRYYQLHGPVDRFGLLSRHLNRVVRICEKYGFRPMLWSDMFFRLGSASTDYYDPDAEIPERAIRALPDVDLCYWDYEHDSRAHFDRMLERHDRMDRPIVFAGGIHTWHGFLPNFRMTDATMVPALQACLAHGTQSVLATIWGDDGNETDLFLALSRLALFSEACWKGEIVASHWKKVGEWISGRPEPVHEAMAAFFPGPGDNRIGKALVWGDLLYPFFFLPHPEKTLAENLITYAGQLGDALQTIRKTAPQDPESRYAEKILLLTKKKAEYMAGIRTAYGVRDLPALRSLAAQVPGIAGLEDEVRRLHKVLWTRDFKVQGWELLCRRYGATSARLLDVKEEIDAFLEGETSHIPVLDEKILPPGRKGGMQFYQTFTVPSHYL